MAPTLSTLKDNGIVIEDDPKYMTRLPPCAEELRQLLLNFRSILPLSRERDLDDYCKYDEPFEGHQCYLEDAAFYDSRHRTYESRWVAASNLRDKAKHLNNREDEETWKGLMANFLFYNINEQASDQGIHLKDLLSWGSNQLFTNAVPIRGRLSDGEYQPKPDFWFGLGLYNKDQLSRLQGLELLDKGVNYFTQKRLQLTSAKSSEVFLYQPVKSKEDSAFPWMVVELKKESKKDSESEEKILRQAANVQAANASYTSLALYERLAARTGKSASPVVALTSVGPKVQVFITYKAEEDTKDSIYVRLFRVELSEALSMYFSSTDESMVQRMSCIWSGNIQHIIYAVQLLRIVDQLMFWALRIFKPWVTECLESWFTEETHTGNSKTQPLKGGRYSPGSSESSRPRPKDHNSFKSTPANSQFSKPRRSGTWDEQLKERGRNGYKAAKKAFRSAGKGIGVAKKEQ